VTAVRRAIIAMSVLALTATACGSGGTGEEKSVRERIEVSGAFGKAPEIRIDAPLELSESSSWVAEQGDGDTVGEDSTAILELTLANGRSGKAAISTIDQGQPLEIKLGDQVFPSLNTALVGKPADSRIVVASIADDAYGDSGSPQSGIEGGDPVVMVADILSTDPTTSLDGPTGETLAAPATAPKIKERDGVPVRFAFAKARKPKKLMVIPLRKGAGPAIESPDRIAADYLGQVWGAKQPFGSTFSKEPAQFSIGLGGVVPAWDKALDGQKEGARVMIISPPDMGYGPSAKPGIPANSTLVFVVDVLGVG
jgi:peptidylprolyl isomerase